ncbi:uncharacterized protein BP5553_07986 [Venustampulla echinocandica]|uniref:Uncharacterized protein n=1 Tax=Venustampulla echinocandica TaxID=2656787 RepID=A0A370TFE0_9HELO|nr:uncharacterized protein BP5553_07986 [Venustampulla echinocandica]RDL33618.1 hypothetical protein BP5553_07986 [Venustampulla echinocandica]
MLNRRYAGVVFAISAQRQLSEVAQLATSRLSTVSFAYNNTIFYIQSRSGGSTYPAIGQPSSAVHSLRQPPENGGNCTEEIKDGLKTAQARVGIAISKRSPSVTHFYCVKFYPYTKPGVDDVFAVVGGDHILICRPPPPGGNDNPKAEVIQFVVEKEPGEDFFTCAWTKDLKSGEPLLCVAGHNANIKIINALTGKLLRTLTGHGGEIYDLAISPLNPTILASASLDYTVRIWSLDPAHENQPCAAILEGVGHREAVLSIAFHSTGRYLLSGGADHIINLWTLPEFPDKNTGTSKPTRIHYPHFSTSEIHHNIVDCVAFHGDLIFSKVAVEECIVLWSITNFNSKNTPPSPDSAPTPHDTQRETRSAFSSSTLSTSGSSNQYTRLLQFDTPKTTESAITFTRFSLYPGDSTHNPVLSFCNATSKALFWDLGRLEAYHDLLSSGADLTQTATRPPFLNPFQHRNQSSMHGTPAQISKQRANSPTESCSSRQTGSDVLTGDKEKGKVDWDKSLKNWAGKYEMGDVLEALIAHKEEIVRGVSFTGRSLAWSNTGNWCVVAGSGGVFTLLHRWGR